MIAENSIFVENYLWNDNVNAMYLNDIAVIQGINPDWVISCAMKLVDDGFAIDIEDGLCQLWFDALHHSN